MSKETTYKMTSLLFRVASNAILATLLCSSLSFGQNKQTNPKGVAVQLSVDGLSCGAATQGTVDALTFQFTVTDATSTGGGGAGAGKVTFGDLLVQRSPDSCSLPIMLLAASGRTVKQVILTEVDKANKPVITITLANVLISIADIKGPDSADVAEQLAFSYASATVTDSAGNTTGTITR
jgi:type VI secretion system secreted protein Hcp